ncbi:hypothetical protein VNO80_16088 [Phaseolus coccineus]|uniref:Uncharacterized protein n=1 Tax=Phaseolus coccineus TaxID=3886 RepID=A0AAN9QZS6_PHACN
MEKLRAVESEKRGWRVPLEEWEAERRGERGRGRRNMSGVRNGRCCFVGVPTLHLTVIPLYSSSSPI